MKIVHIDLISDRTFASPDGKTFTASYVARGYRDLVPLQAADIFSWCTSVTQIVQNRGIMTTQKFNQLTENKNSSVEVEVLGELYLY